MIYQQRVLVVSMIIAATSCLCMAQQVGLRISTSSSRALFDLIEQLNRNFGWSVNYEDAPVKASEDLVDITSPNYKGSGRAYKFFSKPVSVQTDLPNPGVLSKEEQTDVLAVRAQEKRAIEAVLQAYRSSGNHGSFMMVQDGRYIDVFPDKVHENNGTYSPFEAVLSTKVSIPDGSYRLDQLIWMVCDQVAQKRGIPIIHGAAPLGTLMAITLRESADNEPARDVLVNAFEDSKAVRASHGAYDVRYFRWALLYDPGLREYAMNIEWTSKDLPGKTDPTKYNPSQKSGSSQWVHKPSASQPQ